MATSYNPKVVGSNSALATNKKTPQGAFFVCENK